MESYKYDKVARAELLTELHNAGINDAVVNMDDTRVWVTTAHPRSEVDPVVNAHNPAAYEAVEGAQRRTYDDAVAFLKTFYQTPNANITIDQTKNAIKALTVIARTQHDALRLDS